VLAVLSELLEYMLTSASCGQ